MRKSFKKALSLVLAAALAFSTPIATNATSAGAAVTGDVVDVTESMELNDAIGDGTTTGGFFGNFTKYYRLTGDFNVTFTMETTSDVALNWNTPIVVVTNDEDRAPAENPGNYVEYVVARSDNYCVAGGAHTVATGPWDTDNASWTKNDEWAGWVAAYKDATIEYNIVRVGDVVTINQTATGKGASHSYKQIYVVSPATMDDTIRLFWTAEACKTAKLTNLVVEKSLVKNCDAVILGGAIEVSYENGAITPDSVEVSVNDEVLDADGQGRYLYVPTASGTYTWKVTGKKDGFDDEVLTGTISVAVTDDGIVYDYDLASDLRASKTSDSYVISYTTVEGAEATLTLKDADGKVVALDENKAVKFDSLVDGKEYTATLVVTKAGYADKTYTAKFTYAKEKQDAAAQGVKRTQIGKTVGTTDCKTAFWTQFEGFKIEDAKKYTFVFENHGSGAKNWNNFVLVLANMNGFLDQPKEYVEYAVIRSDNYGWSAKDHDNNPETDKQITANTSLSGKAITFTNSITDPAAGSAESWTEWASIIKDSNVSLSVTRSGSVILFEATITSIADASKKIAWTATVDVSNADGSAAKDVCLGFTVDSSYVNLKYVDEEASTVKIEKPEDSTVAPTVKPGSKKNMMIKSISAKVGGKTISGEVNAPNATVEIKVGKGAWKKATMSGKKFSLKVAKLKIGTKITVKASAEGYSTAEQSKTLKGTMKLSAVKAKKGSKKITGKISVKKATVQVKVGKAKFKKAKVTGKKFTFKTKKLKKGTKIKIKVTKKNYKTVNKTVKVK